MSGALVLWGVIILLYLTWLGTPQPRGGLSERGGLGSREHGQSDPPTPSVAPLAESDGALLNRDAVVVAASRLSGVPEWFLSSPEPGAPPPVYDQEAQP